MTATIGTARAMPRPRRYCAPKNRRPPCGTLAGGYAMTTLCGATTVPAAHAFQRSTRTSSSIRTMNCWTASHRGCSPARLTISTRASDKFWNSRAIRRPSAAIKTRSANSSGLATPPVRRPNASGSKTAAASITRSPFPANKRPTSQYTARCFWGAFRRKSSSTPPFPYSVRPPIAPPCHGNWTSMAWENWTPPRRHRLPPIPASTIWGAPPRRAKSFCGTVCF